jgi:hypothetical protein
MSRNDKFEKLMRSLIKQVMRNRQDISARNDFVYEVVFYTLHSPKLMHMIKEWTVSSETSPSPEEAQLAHIIELLALINRTIDILLMKGNGEDNLFPKDKRHSYIPAPPIS